MSENGQFDNTNRGAMFVNKNKKTERHPDRTGSLNVEGVDYFVSGWLKTSRAGEKYMSLSITKKEKQPEPQDPNSAGGDDFDDDIPF